MHMSDHAGDAKHIPAGEGEADWKAIKKALGGYSGYYTLEPSYRFYLSEPENKLAKAYSFISRLMEGDE